MAKLDHELANSDLSRVNLLFLGDSITEFWDPEVFQRYYGSVGTLNLGVGGDTTQGMLWRVQRIGLGAALRPKLVVLLIGTNNTYPNGNARAVAIGIGEVVRTIRQLSPSSRILLLGLLPRGAVADDPFRRMGHQVNQLIAACPDDKTIFYADPGRRLADPDKGVSHDIEADYLHPTPLADRLLSKDLDVEIRKLLGKPRITGRAGLVERGITAPSPAKR